MTVPATSPHGAERTWPEARALAGAVDALPPVLLPPSALARGEAGVLAEPLVSLVPVPAVDTAAMDGYAVRGRGPWRVVGRVLAGADVPPPVVEGTAVEVATGAPVPAGTDGVLPVEAAVRVGDEVTGPRPEGRHVRWAGEEAAVWTTLLPGRTPVTAAVLGLAAAVGHDALRVHPRPRVLALVTGDELLRSGLPAGGRVRDAVGPMLPALVGAYRGVLVGVRHVGDSPGELAAALAAADADVVVTTGASSVGPADRLRESVADGDLLVDGIACRPGHPTLLCRWRGRWVVGLPGNPLAALAGAATVLEPLLAALGGTAPVRTATARLAVGIAPHARAWRLVPVRVRGGVAVPTGHGGAAMLRGAAAADALAVVPPGAPVREVELLPLP